MRRNKKYFTQQHFTLLEVLVAACIIAVSLGVLLAAYSELMHSSTVAEDYVTASRLARLKLHELMQQRELRETQSEGVFPGYEGRYQWRIAVNKRGGDKDTVYALRVEVRFRGSRHQPQSLVLDSLMVVPEPQKQSDKNGQPLPSLT